MGRIIHHAIIVTTWHRERIDQAHALAATLFPAVSPILAGIESYTFSIPPDGSKEGWPASHAGDDRRQKFIDWLETQRDEDRSSMFKWAEVEYGETVGRPKVTRCDTPRGYGRVGLRSSA